MYQNVFELHFEHSKICDPLNCTAPVIYSLKWSGRRVPLGHLRSHSYATELLMGSDIRMFEN